MSSAFFCVLLRSSAVKMSFVSLDAEKRLKRFEIPTVPYAEPAASRVFSWQSGMKPEANQGSPNEKIFFHTA
jgi:hypothetical protein